MLRSNKSGKPGQKVSYWISGGHQNHGKQIPGQWTSAKVVVGFITWKVLMDPVTIAGQIINPLYPINSSLATMLFVMKTAIPLQSSQVCIGRFHLINPAMQPK